MLILREVYGAVVLSSGEIVHILEDIGWKKIIEAIAETFVEEAHGRVVSPAKTIIDFPEANNDYRIMPSYMEKYPDVCGVKIVGACADNPKKYNLPLAVGMYILNNKWTQLPLLMFDASITTAWRTAAATAVAIKELSNPSVRTLGIIGCGMQAAHHIPAILSIRKEIDCIMVHDLNEARMDAIVTAHHCKHVSVVKASKEDIFKQADIVVTMTPTTKPHIPISIIPQREMLICAVGGDSQKKMEFEPSVLTVTDHFCDSLEQVMHTGTVHEAIERGYIVEKDLKSLGDLMIGNTHFLDTSKPVKMFFSTGVALEDLAIANLLYNEYNKSYFVSRAVAVGSGALKEV